VAVAEKVLAELRDISTQVRAAVLFDAAGSVQGSTLPTERAERLVSAARLLLDQAEVVRGDDEAKLTQLEAATPDGSVFVVRDGDHAVVAITDRDPLQGLVYHDLRACLRKSAPRTREKVGA
jgi:predicted regulator of Ras-like GTPase activity (Roadblock/LC7/MglB family)